MIEGYTNGIPDGVWRMLTILSVASAATISGFAIGYAWPLYRPLWTGLIAALLGILGLTIVLLSLGVLG